MTKKDFALFKKRVKHWRNRLGLKDWEISIDKDELDENCVGQCFCEPQNRCATITIDNTIKNLTRRGIDIIALHETLEVLLWDTRDALNTLYNEDATDKHVHRIIRRLENALK